MSRTFRKQALILAVLAILTVLLVYKYMLECNDFDTPLADTSYNRSIPLIFIGGMPRSGTTLMRAMMDAHQDIRCGEETRIIPRILMMKDNWYKSEKESMRLEEAGITRKVVDSAIAAFVIEVITKHGPVAPRLCNKDPLTLKSAVYLGQLFPKAKFLFMIRDGRAVVHSIITRKVTITGFDLTSYRQCLSKWSNATKRMNDQCWELGPSRCLPVYYEQLVLHPKHWMEKILTFLEVPWDDAVLHHEEHINKPGGISLSLAERSTDQVIKPVNVEALSKWVGHIPQDVVKDMHKVAPMLAEFGYDPHANPPKYGDPDSVVADNTNDIKQNEDLWKIRVKEALKNSKRNGTVTKYVPVLPNEDAA